MYKQLTLGKWPFFETAFVEIRPPVEKAPGNARIKPEIPLSASARSVIHLLDDATKQLEFFKWKFDQNDFGGFSVVSHEIAVAEREERQEDRKIGRSKLRSFDKEKFKPDPHSDKARNEKIARKRRRRGVCIQTEHGAVFRGLNVKNSPNKPWGVIVENGVWPDPLDGERPVPTVVIESPT